MDHMGNQLLRMLKRPVVVATSGDLRRQSVGLMERAHELVRRRLARRIGAVGRGPSILVAGRVFRRQRPVNLVGRDLEEPKRVLFRIRQATPVLPHLIEEVERPPPRCSGRTRRETGSTDRRGFLLQN